MSRFDWCARGEHGDCTKSFKRFYFGPIGAGRKKRTGLIYTDIIIECDCKCHKKGKAKNK